MKCVDKWVFLDEVQMIKNGWIHRNRVLKQVNGWYYINVPLRKHPHTTPIKEITIRNEEPWKEKIIARIGHYKSKAPFYRQTIQLLEEAFHQEFDTITHQNAHLLMHICKYLGFGFSYDILSEMDLKIEPVQEPDDWALNISRALNADHYVNPIKGKSFFDTEKYERAGIHINFLNKLMTPYDQHLPDGRFIEGLSIVDIMMFNSPEEILKRLDEYTLE